MSYSDLAVSSHPHLIRIVENHLLNHADWRSVTQHAFTPRPLLSGIPPEPVYVEWLLPVDLREKWSPRKMAEVFDSLPEGVWGENAKGEKRTKRMLLAVVAEDSTVSYYFVHDGIVKPRQN
ncbi:tRNA-splicing endonuclease subunit Sen15 [Pyronema domesticum]|nr:tRNA-splicing endonuclease subunit Sen15 [Pyronema domesticum]